MVPNQHSYLNHQLAPILLPYTNLLGINSLWQFFAPDPGPAVYFEYEIPDPDPEVKSVTQYYPELKSTRLFKSTYNRYVSTIRLISKYPKLIDFTLGPELCRRHPGLVELNLGFVAVRFPSLEDVEHGKQMNSIADRDYKFIGSYLCNEERST